MEDSMLHLRVSPTSHLEVYPPARAGLCSLLLHAATVTYCSHWLRPPRPPTHGPSRTARGAPGLAPWLPSVHPSTAAGRGDHSPLPAAGPTSPHRIHAVHAAVAVLSNPNPILPMEPTVIGSQIQLSEVKPLPFGDPFAAAGPRRTDAFRRRVGDGQDGGVGSGKGPEPARPR